NLIRKVIDDELIRQKAKAEGVAATPEELTAKYDEHKKRFGTEEMYKSFLERTQQTDEDVRKDLESNLVRDKLFAKLMASEAPAPDEAQKYYEENKDKYKQREQIRASHILFKVAATDPADVKQAKEKKAKEVLALAKKAGADFAALAKEHSEGPTAPKGGDLGSFSRGRMVKEFEDAAFTAKIGTVIGPVETKFGYHLIKVFEKTPERERSFDEVKDSITASLEARAKSKATRDILKTMKTEAKIEVLEPGIDLERRRAAPVGADGAALGVRPTQLPVGGAPGAGAAAVQQIKLNAATAKEAGAQEGAAE
ncbi:MAG: peptidylprolyl isomerase, partial [Myxococcota bacterium]